jgi:hypothetical protein
MRAGRNAGRRVAEELAEALDDECILLRGYCNSRGEIDALLLGPRGLFAIEEKYRSVRVNIRGDEWTAEQIDKYGKTRSARFPIRDGKGRSQSEQVKEPVAALSRWLKPDWDFAPTLGAGQAPHSKHWKPVGRGTCSTGTPSRREDRGPHIYLAYTRLYLARICRRIGAAHNPHGSGGGWRAGVSTDSARGPETTGNNRHQPGNRDMRTGRPTHHADDPSTLSRTRETPAQRPKISPSEAGGPLPSAGSGWCPRRSG